MINLTRPSISLQPCPFCGHPAMQTYAHGVYSSGCHNRICPVHPKAASTCENESCRKWNSRAEVPHE